MAISNLLSQFDTIVMVISFIVAIGSLGIGRCAIYERYTDSTNTLILSVVVGLDCIISDRSRFDLRPLPLHPQTSNISLINQLTSDIIRSWRWQTTSTRNTCPTHVGFKHDLLTNCNQINIMYQLM
jgi:hypothetical protein